VKYLNVVVEGNSEEAFVNEVLAKHLAPLKIFVSARRIRTGWDATKNKPAKGGMLKYIKFRNDVLNWIESDKGRANSWYTSMVDLYAFPKDDQSPYDSKIQAIKDPYQKITVLEAEISKDINHKNFIPYVQLHEFETFILVDPDKLLVMYPESQVAINRLKKDIGSISPERINESPHTAPSKRIISYLPVYEKQKPQVGPLVAEDIGITKLRNGCPHFNEWIEKLEDL